jgi:hypothetical protein
MLEASTFDGVVAWRFYFNLDLCNEVDKLRNLLPELLLTFAPMK